VNAVSLYSRTLRADISPVAGASVVSFEGKFGEQWLPLMRPTPPEAVAAHNTHQMASFNLVPWSNRIVGAAFEFQGRRYTLRANTPQGFAIHGDASTRAWRVADQREDSLTCAIDSRDFPDFNFPFPFTAQIRYALTDTTFDTALTLTNVGQAAMPAGFGFHPYFNRGLGASSTDEAELQLKAAGVYPPLPNMVAQQVTTPEISGSGGLHRLPPDMDFSTLTRIGNRDIDHCFGGWDGRATIAYPSSNVRLEFECDPVFGHVIVYTPPGRPFFAVEPVTHANDAFNMLAAGVPGSGARVLQAGEHLSGTFRIRVNAG
jgi:aldose 1-epimerase